MLKNSIFILLFLISTIPNFAQNSDAIIGEWLNEKKDKIVSIYKSNDLYYGKIVWVKDSEAGKGNERLDIKNPNSDLKNKKIIDLDYLLSFSYFSERNVWKEGKIYNFDTGNTYSGKIHINEDGDLELTGYFGILWFLGRTQIWTRTTE